ncbi:MAG: twin transmembrane helix small protein [Pseudomonadota bacterium]
MLIKLSIVILMICILVSLFRSLFFLVRERDNSFKTVNALKWRVFFSVLLVIMLIIGAYTGDLQPHGLPQIDNTQS